MSLFKRKPKAPDTPARRFDHSLNAVFGMGMAAGGSVACCTYALSLSSDMVRNGSAASAWGWGGAVFVFVAGVGIAALMGFVYAKIKRGLMQHAPAGEREA